MVQEVWTVLRKDVARQWGAVLHRLTPYQYVHYHTHISIIDVPLVDAVANPS